LILRLLLQANFNYVSVLFDPSDYCFIKIEHRESLDKASNQDYLTRVFNALAIKLLDFSAGLRILKDEETEAEMKQLHRQHILDPYDNVVVEGDVHMVREEIKRKIKLYMQKNSLKIPVKHQD